MDKATKMRQRLKGAKYVRDELQRTHPYLLMHSGSIGCGDYDCENAHENQIESIVKDMLDDADASVRKVERDIRHAECKGHEFLEYNYCVHCDMPLQ